MAITLLLTLSRQRPESDLTAVSSTAQEVSDVDTEDARDAQEAPDAGLRAAGFDVLVRGTGDPRREEHGLLCPVLPYACDADAVTDGALLLKEPVVVIGQGRHPTNALPKIIVSQPGLPGIL
ncbi:hypothetical protein [Streptomyces prasinus]|uniref:hypothetical protein n=1 Tax=Streptomyces prasinus TaxID=67345 RepID=UPI003D9EADBA